MSKMDDSRDRADRDRTLGEAANRWVTWRIVMLFFFFLPMWNSFPRR
jgi:hypothetical protein